jgi:DNA-binding NarL/FixJ family response regulator
MPKQDNLSEILNCIDAVSKGRHYVNSLIGEDMLNQFFVARKTEPLKFSQLTEKQSNIAEFLSKGIGTWKIAETLNLKPSTLSTVQAVILQKMKVASIMELSNVLRTELP